MLTDEQVAELAQRAEAEQDPAQRARLLGIDLTATAAVRRRYQITVWSVAIGLSSALLLVRTSWIGFVAGHGRFDPWIGPYLADVVIAIVIAVFSAQFAGAIAGFLVPRLAKALLGRPRTWCLTSIATASLLMSAFLLIPILLWPSDGTFFFGLVIGMPIATAVSLSPVDFAKRVRENHPATVHFVVADRNDRTGHGLLRGRIRWLLGESVGTMAGGMSAVLLLVFSPWAILPLAVVDAMTNYVTSHLKRTNRYRLAVVIDFAVAGILLLVGLVLMGWLIVPRITIGTISPV